MANVQAANAENPEIRKAVFDNLNQLMWEFSVEYTDPIQLRFLWFSERYNELVGIGHKEMAGQLIEDVLSPEDLPNIRAKYLDCAARNERISYVEFLNIGSAGKFRWWRTTLQPTLKTDGRVSRIIGQSELVEAIEARLRTALIEERLEVHFQPIYQLAPLQLAGFEALIRWPKSGYSPGDFLPVAKKSDLMPHITNFVLETTGYALSLLPKNLWIAINVSNSPFSEQLARVTEKYKFAPYRLRFEVTEDTKLIPPVLERFHNAAILGHPFEIDDFGTDQANLHWLGILSSVAAIKLDAQFVIEAWRNENQRTICQAAVSIAQKHKPPIKVVGEGIETEDDLQFAIDIGMDYGQGWLFGKAVPLEKILQDQIS